jgi:uncharacterized protein YegP (UPF0339 family)
MNGIESVKKNAPIDGYYERLTLKSGKHYFTLKVGKHEVIGQTQMYESSEGSRNRFGEGTLPGRKSSKSPERRRTPVFKVVAPGTASGRG